eukprot:TRINITY_DN3961_c0_g1_i1.p4 TRINITY_DN3961_c0_g1~~TRINITY_DN3961_c0_g1_i1.p4  ORF type:complete len:82 (+),score=14.97 TRINITY_DN3961_c0_g1_i1:475-720(+)
MSPFANCPVFQDYDGPDPPGKDFDKACEFIKNLFLNKNQSAGERAIYLHVTCATDKDNIKDVFQDTKDIIMRSCLRKLQMI